ncbi:MAG: hypothetical protein QM501_09950 [Gimesia sp.]
MTLLLTHVSDFGVVMAADSAITWRNGTGKIICIDKKGWQKLFKVRSFRAGVSYWGLIGAINPKFYEAIKYFIEQESKYHDLKSLADYIASEMNSALKGEILTSPTGVHVAGYEKWEDGVRRPTFYHIHNGNGHYETSIENNRLDYEWIKEEEHKLFTVHKDIPHPRASLERNRFALSEGHLTRNGAFYIFSQFLKTQREVIKILNKHEHISIPSRQNNICSQKGMIHMLLQNNINLYKVSNQHRVVGGKVTSIAFNDERYCNG